MKKKLSLEELKVKSFITKTTGEKSHTIKGGGGEVELTIIIVDGITVGFGGCEPTMFCTADCNSLAACTDTIHITDL